MQRKDLIIRAATPRDAGSIADLATQLGYESNPSEIAPRLAFIAQRDNHAVFVAEYLGQVIGWVHVSRRLVLVMGSAAEVLGLVVDAGHHRLGLGKSLMERAELWARAHGLKHVIVRSNVIRHGAHVFYEKLGYVLTKEQAVFRKDMDYTAS